MVVLLITEGNYCNQSNRLELMSVSICLEECWVLLSYLFSVIELMWTDVHFGNTNKFTII